MNMVWAILLEGADYEHRQEAWETLTAPATDPGLTRARQIANMGGEVVWIGDGNG